MTFWLEAGAQAAEPHQLKPIQFQNIVVTPNSSLVGLLATAPLPPLRSVPTGAPAGLVRSPFPCYDDRHAARPHQLGVPRVPRGREPGRCCCPAAPTALSRALSSSQTDPRPTDTRPPGPALPPAARPCGSALWV